MKKLPEYIKNLPEQSKKCPKCHREIIRSWHFCPNCGERICDEIVQRLTLTDAENASFLLNGLINYHERVVGFRSDSRDDRYISALRYALLLVETFLEDKIGDTV